MRSMRYAKILTAASAGAVRRAAAEQTGSGPSGVTVAVPVVAVAVAVPVPVVDLVLPAEMLKLVLV